MDARRDRTRANMRPPNACVPANQWRQYRENAPIIMPLLMACISLRYRVAPAGEPGADARRVVFTACWSLIVAIIMHGTGAFWLFVALVINYYAARLLRTSALGPIWAWAFALTLLFTRLWV
jgi:hypothetical protein